MSAASRTEQNRRYENERRIAESRERKVDRLLNTLDLAAAGATPTAATIRALDDAGWHALEALADTRRASAETRASLIARLERREASRASAPADPFDGFPVTR